MQLFFHFFGWYDQDLVDPLGIHVDNFESKTTPFQFLAGFGDMLQAVEYEARQGVEFMVAFIHPLCLMEVGEKIIERDLGIYQEAAIIPFPDLIVGDIIRRSYFTDDGFKNIVEGHQAQEAAVFVDDKTAMDLGLLEFFHHHIGRSCSREQRGPGT